MPAGKTVKCGVWEDDKFIGVVLFSMGAQIHLVRQYGLTPFEGCELTRIALTNHKTPVTRIMAICIKMLSKKCPKLQLIVSFADPSEGHHGGVYQGSNWVYTGKSADCAFAIVNGKKTHPRTVSEWLKKGVIKSRKEIQHIVMPGKHRYLFPLNKTIKGKVNLLSKSYPKRAGSKDVVAPGFQSGEDGSIPISALQKPKRAAKQPKNSNGKISKSS